MGVWRIAKWLLGAVAVSIVSWIIVTAFRAYGIEEGFVRVLQGRWEAAMPEWLGLLYTPAVFVLGLLTGMGLESWIRARQGRAEPDPEPKPELDKEALYKRLDRLYGELGVSLKSEFVELEAHLAGEAGAVYDVLKAVGVELSPLPKDERAAVESFRDQIGLIKSYIRDGNVDGANRALTLSSQLKG